MWGAYTVIGIQLTVASLMEGQAKYAVSLYKLSCLLCQCSKETEILTTFTDTVREAFRPEDHPHLCSVCGQLVQPFW